MVRFCARRVEQHESDVYYRGSPSQKFEGAIASLLQVQSPAVICQSRAKLSPASLDKIADEVQKFNSPPRPGRTSLRQLRPKQLDLCGDRATCIS